VAFDFAHIAGLERGAHFGAGESSGRDFLQDGYVYNVASPLTFFCPSFPVGSDRDAGWSPPGVPTHSLDLRTETAWDTSGLTPADDPAKEGLTGETLAGYAARVGTPDYLVCTGFGDVVYSSYWADCSTSIDPGFPAYGIELDGESVAFGSGERGLLALGVNAEGVHGQGALNVAVAKAAASYTGDPTNDATLCLFAWTEFETAVLFFEDGYVAHVLQNDISGGRGYGVTAYYLTTPPPSASWMCVL
jgi:hypothetical protein